MNAQLLLAIVTIVAALGLVGAVVTESIVVSQEAFADSPWKGCKPGSEGFKNSDKKCRHHDHD
jgi:hypothetical protein